MQRTAIISLAFAATATLAGCDLASTQATMEGLTWNTVTADVSRASEEAFAELPSRAARFQ